MIEYKGTQYYTVAEVKEMFGGHEYNQPQYRDKLGKRKVTLFTKAKVDKYFSERERKETLRFQFEIPEKEKPRKIINDYINNPEKQLKDIAKMNDCSKQHISSILKKYRKQEI